MLCSTPQNRLRGLRLGRGLTLEQVSLATGLSVSTVHAMEADERGTLLGSAFKLALFYGLPVESIWQPLYDQICQEMSQKPIPIG